MSESEPAGGDPPERSPETTDAGCEGQDGQLQDLAPLMKLLDQARDAVVTPPSNWKSMLRWQPPDRLGDFHLIAPIGRGGMGVVYEARQESLDRIVAIKVLPPFSLPDGAGSSAVSRHASLVERFHTEARAAARLHHPNIVPVFGFGQSEGFYYFVMQRIEGRGLDRWIERHGRCGAAEPVPAAELYRRVADWGRQAASGLAYAHQQGVLHRDIKPANLLVDEHQTLQIADFGVARIDGGEAITQTSDVVGTLRYMAPEQITGNATAQSDVYSLGVTLYEMITGTPAVDDASVRQAIAMQQRPRGPVPLTQAKPDTPRDLGTIIETAMQPEAARRYRDAAALADDLKRFLDGRPIRARRTPWWERSARWVGQNRTITVLGTLLFVSLTLAAGLSVTARRRIQSAYEETLSAKREAERSAELASGALEKIFTRFAASGDSTSIDFAATDFSVPSVDPKTVALLEELLGYYDFLAAESGSRDGPPFAGGIRPGRARMQLAAIHHQLGNLPAAIEAYQSARRELEPDDRLSLAKLLNQIGIAYEAMGQSDRAKSFHAQAIDTLRELGGPEAAAAVRFELARGRLLQLRKVRPGTGPQSLPPTDAFEMDLSRRRPRPLRFGLRMRLGFLFPPRETLAESEREPLIEIVRQLLALRDEVPDSVPVTLLLSHAVRQTMGDVLQARGRQFDQPWLVRLAEDLEAELDGQLQRRSEQGNEAAIAYELVLLLSDFNVFRQLRPDEMDPARRRLTKGLSYARYLTERYPNVPAYETLAIHTAYKLAVLQRMFVPDRREEFPERLRMVRSLMQLALRGQRRLLESHPDGDGYALWCSLFTMQLGDLQRFAGARRAALQSYQDALGYLPLRSDLAGSDLTGSDLAGSDLAGSVSGIEAASWSAEDRRTLATAVGEVVRRYAEAVEPEDADAARLARDLGERVGEPSAVDWTDVSGRVETLIGDRGERDLSLPLPGPFRRLDRSPGAITP